MSSQFVLGHPHLSWRFAPEVPHSLKRGDSEGVRTRPLEDLEYSRQAGRPPALVAQAALSPYHSDVDELTSRIAA